MDLPATNIPLVSEEIFDKEPIPLTASSSLTIRTTSDDEITNTEPPVLPPMEIQSKVFRSFQSSFY